ncbi:MAG: nucleoside deaminase [Pseudomonadota bacterium]
MDAAFECAQAAARAGDVPIGAVIVRDGKVIARAGNRVVQDTDASAHAEIVAIRAAGKVLGSERLLGCDLYVTLEPCPMCAQAISYARIRRLYFAAYDPKGGGVEHGPAIFDQPTCHHRPEVYGGLREAEAAQRLTDFFKAKRA